MCIILVWEIIIVNGKLGGNDAQAKVPSKYFLFSLIFFCVSMNSG